MRLGAESPVDAIDEGAGGEGVKAKTPGAELDSDKSSVLSSSSGKPPYGSHSVLSSSLSASSGL